MFLDQSDWTKLFEEKGALWMRKGKGIVPHVRLTSGLHSNGFFNSRVLMSDILLPHSIASDLCDLLMQGNPQNMFRPLMVVGPQTGATKLAEMIALKLGENHGVSAFFTSPAKVGKGAERRFIFDDSQPIMQGTRVLLCEDVLTTGSSINLVEDEVMRLGGEILPYLLVILNRSANIKVLRGKEIISLVRRPMDNWQPEECPLCKENSEAISPKESSNWDRLTAVAV